MKDNYDRSSWLLQGCGGDEIVGCAWDGMTYIVDQKRNVVKFNFGENVCAFSAGEILLIYKFWLNINILIKHLLGVSLETYLEWYGEMYWYCVLPCTASVMHSWVYSRGIFQTDVYGHSAMPQTIRCPLRCVWVSGRCMGKGRTNELNNLNITQNIGQ